MPYDYTVEMGNNDRVPEELWTEVHDIVQEEGIKTIPKKKKCKKAKWLFDEALQIAEKRREAKGKREKERYTHLGEGPERGSRGQGHFFGSQSCWVCVCLLPSPGPHFMHF